MDELAIDARQMSGFKPFYQFIAPTRVIAGRDLLSGVGFEFAKEGATRVEVITDQVLRETGLVDRVIESFEDGGIELAGIFDDVPPDSDTRVVERAAEQAKADGADAFLAIGGGSVMDTAKVADVVFTHGGNARDWEGYFLLPRERDGLGKPEPVAPIACVPTTAGTGSESSFAAVIKDADEKIKFQVGDFPICPRLAVLDPESTRTLPPHIAAATGMDAMTHAIEGYVSSEWNPHADAYALQALRLIRDNLERAVHHPEDDDARGNMLIAANLAIMPTSSGALGIAHSLSHPAGALYGVPHGVANAINLPQTIEFNAAGGDDIAERYRDINDVLGLEVGGSSADVASTLADHVRGLVSSLGLPTRLSEVGVPESGIPELAEMALGDGCTLVNPRETTTEDFERMYAAAL
jgi:alcohol dehydrogenase class IV